MSDLRLSMVLTAQADQAKREVADTATGVRDLGAATVELQGGLSGISTAMTGSATAAGSLGDAVAGLHRQIDGEIAAVADAAEEAAHWQAQLAALRAEVSPLSAALQHYEATLGMVTSAEQAGAISGREAALAHDLLSRKIAEVSAQAQAAGYSLRGPGEAAQASATGIQQMIERMTGIEAASQGAAAASLRHGHELDRLRAQYNPLFAAARQYELQVLEVADAERQGAISAAEGALAHDQLSRQLAAVTAQAPAAGVPLRGVGEAATASATGLQQMIERLTGVEAASQGAAGAGLRHGHQLDELRARFSPLFAASRQYELQLREIADAERLGAITAAEAANARERAAVALAPLNAGLQQFATNSRAATAHAANLSFQINDIVMMATTGQAPMTLMMQQGPQVVQIMGQLRMSGLSLGTALRSALGMVLHPAGLATMALVGLGTAGVQAFMNMRDETKSLEDVLAEARQGVDELRAAMDRSSPRGLDELERAYGRITAEVERLAAAQERVARRRREDAFEEARDRVLGEIMPPLRDDPNRDYAARGVGRLRRELELTVPEAQRLYAEIQRMAQLQVPGELADQYARIVQMLEGLEQHNALNDAGQAMIATLVAAEDIARELAALLQGAGQRDNPRAERMLADLLAEATLLEAIARHGDDSRIVTGLRVEAERRAFAEIVRTMEISEELKQQLRAAWEAANGLAAVDMRAGLAAARAEAAGIAAEIERAVAASRGLADSGQAALEDARIRAQYSNPVEQARRLAESRMRRTQGVRRQGAEGGELAALEAEVRAYGDLAAQAAAADEARRRAAQGARAGARDTERSREAVEDLIRSLEDEIDTLRETDPVQRDLIRHREVLAHATATERAEVEELIRIRFREAEALEQVQRRMDDIRQTATDVFREIIRGASEGTSVSEILSRIFARLADQLANLAATGLSDLLFGKRGGSAGGLFGGLWSALFPSAAPAAAVSAPAIAAPAAALAAPLAYMQPSPMAARPSAAAAPALLGRILIEEAPGFAARVRAEADAVALERVQAETPAIAAEVSSAMIRTHDKGFDKRVKAASARPRWTRS